MQMHMHIKQINKIKTNEKQASAAAATGPNQPTTPTQTQAGTHA
jgi:hypothetical protein